MSASIELNLDILNDYIEDTCGGKEYFFGCWSQADFDAQLSGNHANIQLVQGKNWIVLRNGADKIDGLVFPKVSALDPEVTIFKGYLAEQAIHSYSDGDVVRKYWSENIADKHNGIFSAVTITDGGKKLNFITDIFGIGAVFIRKVGDYVFFSSTAGLLTAEDDKVNNMSWAMRLILGYVPGNDTLVEDVTSLSPASVVTFHGGQVSEKVWYDYNDFPKGTEPFDDYCLEQSQAGFKSAMQRCLNVENGDNLLALSSGYDSRRMFAQLSDLRAPFKTCSVQMPALGGEDIDAVIAKQISDDYEVDHVSLKMESPETWFKNRKRKILSFDGLTQNHNWSVQFFDNFKDEKLCIYDGLNGDNYLFPNWEFIPSTLEVVPTKKSWFLKDEYCESVENIEDNFNKLWTRDLYGKNNTLINFILWQTRNSTGYWAQLQSRPGHIVVCPYMDLEYIELMLRFRMENDDCRLPQKSILDKFWPDLAKYSGTRELPENSNNIAKQRYEMETYAQTRLVDQCLAKGHKSKLSQVLKNTAKITIWMSRHIIALDERISWWAFQLTELAYWWDNRPIFFKIADGCAERRSQSNKVSLNLEVINQYIEKKCSGKEYFLGLWSPENININSNDIPENIQLEQGNNWAVLRNGSDICDGLLFPKIQRGEAGPEMVVFRGYLAEAQIHSYSAKKDVRDYWSENLMRRHNGVFSAVTISDGGSQLSFVSDIFGIGPIYFRKIGDVVLFSSCSATLAMQDDQADLCSWLLNLSIGFIPGNDTMTKEIKQPDPASVTSFTREGMKTEMWHDPSSFPKGDGVVDDDIYVLSHKQFEKAVQRCMNLSHGKQLLPLSSGHDSRRIFGHMIDSEQPFEGCTVQMTTATGEDLDLHIGEKMAADHGIDHVAIKVPQKTQWRKNDVKRILSMDGQTQAHTWSVPLFAHYQDQQVTIFDGLGGDVFGFHGLIVNEVKNIETPIAIPNIFKSGLAPSQTHTTEIIDKMKSRHEYGPNHGLLTFLNSVSRKSTSLWAQQQISPGQLVVYPYLDIDYVEMMFSYSYKEKYYERAQFKIMEKYWPKLAAYPSSREIPEGTCNIRELYKTNIDYSFSRLIKDSYERGASSFHYDSLLSTSSRIVLYLNRFSDTLRQHSDWWTHPIIEYMYWWQRRPFVITFDKEDES